MQVSQELQRVLTNNQWGMDHKEFVFDMNVGIFPDKQRKWQKKI